uniref:Uncharacterized protein n=1 Tax=Chrysemys picta bellii TaxID=8478 RepID=A0A8C3HZ55_CHRPI
MTKRLLSPYHAQISTLKLLISPRTTHICTMCIKERRGPGVDREGLLALDIGSHFVQKLSHLLSNRCTVTGDTYLVNLMVGTRGIWPVLSCSVLFKML